MRYNPLIAVALVLVTPLATFAQDQPRLVRLFLQPPQEASQDNAQPKLPAPKDTATPATSLLAPIASSSGSSPTGMWFDAEYLLWWTKNGSSQPLVVTGPSPAANTPGSITGTTTTTGPTKIPTAPGFKGLFTTSTQYHLGVDNATATLFGNDIHGPLNNGGRFTLGSWLDNERTFGVELSYLFLLRSWATFSSGGANPVLAIPYQNAVTGAETSYAVNQPFSLTANSRTFVNTTPGVFVHLFDLANFDGASGNVAIRNSSSLQGGEANAIWAASRGGNWNVDAILGFRFVELDESLSIASTVNQQHLEQLVYEPALGLPTGKIPVANQFNALVSRLDLFETRNSFYGGQIGLRGNYDWGRFFISARGTIGLGVMNESVYIDGGTSTNLVATITPSKGILLAGIPLTVATGAPAQTFTQSNGTRGGLFAQPTNIGHYTHSAFAVVPEGILKLNYRFTDRFTGSLGYTFMYMSTVARPGDQVNHAVNPSQIATAPSVAAPPQPIFQFNTSDYWAQGITFGLDIRY